MEDKMLLGAVSHMTMPHTLHPLVLIHVCPSHLHTGVLRSTVLGSAVWITFLSLMYCCDDSININSSEAQKWLLSFSTLRQSALLPMNWSTELNTPKFWCSRIILRWKNMKKCCKYKHGAFQMQSDLSTSLWVVMVDQRRLWLLL